MKLKKGILKEIEEKGILISEENLYDGLYKDAVDGTKRTYLYNGDMYQVFKRCNNLSYNGKENDINVWENIKEDIKNYNFLFFKSLISYEAYVKLCNILSETPCQEDM